VKHANSLRRLQPDWLWDLNAAKFRLASRLLHFPVLKGANLRLRFLMFALVVGSAAGPAAADNYRFISRSDAQSAVLLDESSVVRTGNTVAYWIIDLDGNYLHSRPSKYAYYLRRDVMDCDGQMLRSTAISFYDPSGNRIVADEKGDETSSIEPGTLEQFLYNTVCRNSPTTDALLDAQSPLSLAQKFREMVTDNPK
jgi:hypothetical protein